MFEQVPLEQRRAQITAVYERMAWLYRVDVAQLHKCLGCSSDLLQHYYFHGQMPIELIQKCRSEHQTTIDWIVNGKPPTDKKLNPQMFDAQFGEVTKGLLQGLSEGHKVDEYWFSLRCALVHRAMRLRKEGRKW